MKSSLVALMRVLEQRARTSPEMIRRARNVIAFLAHQSHEVREMVRLRLMPLV